jgi:hypothetical protein
VAGVLVVVSRASLPAIALGILTAREPVTLPVLVRALVVLTALPGLAAWLIGRAFAAEVKIRGSDLVVQHRELVLEVPFASIERVTPWVVPLPGPGFGIRTRSGRRLRYGLQMPDPTPLLLALRAGGARMTTRHPSILYAHAKRGVGVWRWYHRLGKFIGFALLPTAVMFNLDQHVTYGGLLGQYYLQGLVPYLETFGRYWGLVSIYLLLYASVWRGLAEGATLAAAWVAPPQAARVRRMAEIGCQVIYYGGVPVIVLVPFLQ